jgi:hypothetical protein
VISSQVSRSNLSLIEISRHGAAPLSVHGCALPPSHPTRTPPPPTPNRRLALRGGRCAPPTISLAELGARWGCRGNRWVVRGVGATVAASSGGGSSHSAQPRRPI